MSRKLSEIFGTLSLPKPGNSISCSVQISPFTHCLEQISSFSAHSRSQLCDFKVSPEDSRKLKKKNNNRKQQKKDKKLKNLRASIYRIGYCPLVHFQFSFKLHSKKKFSSQSRLTSISEITVSAEKLKWR